MQSSSMLDKMQAFNTFLICEGVKKYVICCQYIWHIQQTKIKNMDFFLILLYTKKCGRRRRVAFYSHLFHTYIILQFFSFLYYLLCLTHSLSHSYLTPANASEQARNEAKKESDNSSGVSQLTSAYFQYQRNNTYTCIFAYIADILI